MSGFGGGGITLITPQGIGVADRRRRRGFKAHIPQTGKRGCRLILQGYSAGGTWRGNTEIIRFDQQIDDGCPESGTVAVDGVEVLLKSLLPDSLLSIPHVIIEPAEACGPYKMSHQQLDEAIMTVTAIRDLNLL